MPPLRRTLEIMPAGVDGVYRVTQSDSVCCVRVKPFYAACRVRSKAFYAVLIPAEIKIVEGSRQMKSRQTPKTKLRWMRDPLLPRLLSGQVEFETEAA